MASFGFNFVFFNIFLPLISTGAITTGIVLSLIIFFNWKNPLYLATFILGIISFLYVFCEAFIIISSYIMDNPSLGRITYRIEQLFITYFLFGLPFLLSFSIRLYKNWQITNRLISFLGLGIALFLTITAFLKPDSFISTTIYASKSLGRGQEGFLYPIRDLCLIIFTVYSLSFLIFELFTNKNNLLFTFLLLIGLLIIIFTALDDTIYIYKGIHIGLFQDQNFSRVSLGVTLFSILLMSAVSLKFIIQAKSVEEAYEEINKSEEKFLQIAYNINEVFWLINFNPENNKKELLYINPVYEKIWGRDSSELFYSFNSWIEYIHKEDKKDIISNIKDIAKIDDVLEMEYRIILPDKEIRWIRDRISPIKDENGKLFRLARISEDITKRKNAEEKLSYLAYYDPLTGIMNRKSFYERFKDSIIQAKRSKTEKNRALLFIDLDNFKDINDTIGHNYGDKILIDVSTRIKNELRESDYFFRFGGDEFTVILNNILDETDPAIVSQRIISSIVSKPFTVKGEEYYLGISIGISLYPQDGEDANILIKNADTALNEAKREKNIYKYYTNSMEDKAIEKVSIINDLRKAIEKEEFYLMYQPIMDENKVIGAEALIRWEHPEKGMIPPSAFIPAAEDSMLIIPIGEWVLKKACNDFKKLNGKGHDLFLSINISIKQFKEKKLIDKIVSIVKESNINPNKLHIELTESCIMHDINETIEKLHILKNNGIKIAIDDFGTGYSSLSYLESLPIDTIKIDRSFISSISKKKSTYPLVDAMIIMANKLNLDIITEGVELKEQLNYLNSLKCTIFYQGFYFSKPLIIDDLTKFLEENILSLKK